jgi:phosphinothricin acetyltransferase
MLRSLPTWSHCSEGEPSPIAKVSCRFWTTSFKRFTVGEVIPTEGFAVMGKRIRNIEVSDAPAVREIYAPFVSDSVISFEVVPPDVSEVERRIMDLRARYPWLVFESDGRVLGFAYASPHRARSAYQWHVDVSVYINSDSHRHGIGRALYTALFALLRRLGYFNAYAGISLPNQASVGLHESLGFTPIGVFERTGFKFGQWHDVVWLQLRLLEDPIPKEDPHHPDKLFEDDGIVAMLDEYAQTVTLD